MLHPNKVKCMLTYLAVLHTEFLLGGGGGGGGGCCFKKFEMKKPACSCFTSMSVRPNSKEGGREGRGRARGQRGTEGEGVERGKG